MTRIRFKAERIDTREEVKGFYFISPLTDENSKIDASVGWYFLSDGIKRHCISTEDGVVYVVDEKTVESFGT